MESENTRQVSMTADELEEFRAFREAKVKAERDEAARRQRQEYTDLVDSEVSAAVTELLGVSENISQVKKTVLENFQTIIALKGEMYKEKKGEAMANFSHTFTTSDGRMKICLGQYLNDDYLDTAETGISMIRDYIASLATDEKSQALVSMVMRLLAKDGKGTLKAQRIVQLRKIADETGAEAFIEGVRIIEEAYRPTASRTFLRAWRRDASTNGWEAIPLGMTES